VTAICKGCGEKIVGKNIPVIIVQEATITSFGEYFETTWHADTNQKIYHTRCYNDKENKD